MTAGAGAITGRRRAPSRLPVRGVLCDLDGTLIDSAPDLGAAVNRMRTGRGLAPLPDAELRPHASHGARGLIGAGLGITPAEPDYLALRDEFLGYYHEALCVRTVLFPGVAALLDAIEEAGLPWGIVTNKATRLTLPLLDALHLRRRTGCIVCGDTTARSKPHPEPMLAAAGLLALPPMDCVYVGDAERDVEAGNAAGMSTLVARYGYIRQDETPDRWPAQGHLDTALDLLAWLPVTGNRAG